MNPVKDLFESFIKVKRNPEGVKINGLSKCINSPVTDTHFPDADLHIYVKAGYVNNIYAMSAGRCEMDRGSFRPNAGEIFINL